MLLILEESLISTIKEKEKGTNRGYNKQPKRYV